MNNYEKERMKLWREVYVLSIEHSSESTAKSMADDAVWRFDQKFKGSVEVLQEQAG
jgi:hypothetical protein